MVAAGSGTRMKAALPKQFLQLGGKSVLAHSIDAFLRAVPRARILLLVADDHRQKAEAIAASSADPGRIKLVAGGHNRYTSVANGVAELTDPQAIVFVHDGVRCLVTQNLIRLCEKEALEKGSAIPCIPVQDSLRENTGDGLRAVDRSRFSMIQTPQTFRAAWLVEAFRQPFEDSFTDEATVVEKAGFALHFVPGDEENIKLTRPVDLLLAEAILSGRS